MAEKNAENKLDDIIGRFLQVYKILSTEEKVRFEIEIVKKTKDADERTRNLYSALIAAAKDGLDIKEAITKMQGIK